VLFRDPAFPEWEIRSVESRGAHSLSNRFARMRAEQYLKPSAIGRGCPALNMLFDGANRGKLIVQL
jgi:hypothetical protein